MLFPQWKSNETFCTETHRPLKASQMMSKNHYGRQQNWVKIAQKKNSTKHVMDGRIGKRTLSWITREKVKLMEMFTFSLKLYEANTPNDYKMDMGKLKSVYWHSSTYGKLPILFFRLSFSQQYRDSFLSKIAFLSLWQIYLFPLHFFLPEQFAILPSRYTQLETWIK